MTLLGLLKVKIRNINHCVICKSFTVRGVLTLQLKVVFHSQLIMEWYTMFRTIYLLTFLSQLANVINRSVLLIVTDLISNSKTFNVALSQRIFTSDPLCFQRRPVRLLRIVKFCLQHERQRLPSRLAHALVNQDETGCSQNPPTFPYHR